MTLYSMKRTGARLFELGLAKRRPVAFGPSSFRMNLNKVPGIPRGSRRYWEETMARQTKTTSYQLGAAAIYSRPAGWMQQVRRIGFGVLAALAVAGSAGQAPAADERF